jgi:MFS family permease
VSGIGFGVFGPVWDTTMQRQLPPEVLSRASAYDWFGSMVLLPIGFAIEGWIASWLGVNGSLWLGASWLVVTVAVVLAIPSVRSMPNHPVGAQAERPAGLEMRPHDEEIDSGRGHALLGAERHPDPTIS